MNPKTQQLQIRVTPEEKKTLKRLAHEAGQGVSSYVLSRVLPPAGAQFTEILRRLARNEDARFALAELNDLLVDLAPVQFGIVLEDAALCGVSPYHQNYVAAMVELAAERKEVPPPSWTSEVRPLEEPRFAVQMASLRSYLLRASPVAFKRRNIFIDSSVGDRV